MTIEETKKFSNMVKILAKLDEKSLFLIESGAKLLMARQNMDEERKTDLNEKEGEENG